MNTSNQRVHPELDEIEQAAEMVKSSIKKFVDALGQFLDPIGEHGDQEIPIAALTRFGQSLKLVGNDLTEAGNKTLSRIADASHKATSPTPTRARNMSEGTDSSPS
jgi:hypothetical protein